MWRSQLKIIFRSLIREKFFAVLNLTCLAIGLASTLIIALFIVDELQYDQFHQKLDRLYRIDQTDIWNYSTERFASTGPGVAPAILTEVPEFEEITRIHTPGNMWVKREGELTNNAFEENYILAVDSNFAKVFTFPFIHGDELTAFHAPNSVVLTAKTAKKYFGEEAVVGETLLIGRGNTLEPYQVTGVLVDPPEQSHIRFDMLLSMNSFPQVEKQAWSWIWTTFVTYGILHPSADPEQVSAKLLEVPNKHVGVTTERIFGVSYEEYLKENEPWELYLQPVTDIYLYTPKIGNRLGTQSDSKLLMGFGFTGAIILVLSCINFMNLSTARATRRAKEVGVKKVLGARKGMLTIGFLAEAVVYSFISLAVAVGLVEFACIPLNEITEKSLSSWQLISSPEWLIALMLIPLIAGLLAGSYPAFYLTQFKPTDVMKASLSVGNRSLFMRNPLIVFQFFIAISLIICSLTIHEQMRFLQEMNLGLAKDQVVVVSHAEWLGKQGKAFQDELSAHNTIASVAISNFSPPNVYSEDYFFPTIDQAQKVPMSTFVATGNYPQTVGLELLAGRWLQDEGSNTNNQILLNQQALIELGWLDANQSLEDALGKNIYYPGNGLQTFEVVGIVQDFHFQSLHHPIRPIIFLQQDAPIWKSTKRHVSIRFLQMDRNGIQEVLSHARTIWEEFVPEVPFEYHFLDDSFNAQFNQELTVGKLLTGMTIIAILIASIGLFGIAAYTTERRSKEIGIRKVLGASAYQVLHLLNREFLMLGLVAFGVATPIAWWLMLKWLALFAYQVDIQISIFLLAGGLTLLLTWLTVSFHTFRAANANPTQVLSED